MQGVGEERTQGTQRTDQTSVDSCDPLKHHGLSPPLLQGSGETCRDLDYKAAKSLITRTQRGTAAAHVASSNTDIFN